MTVRACRPGDEGWEPYQSVTTNVTNGEARFEMEPYGPLGSSPYTPTGTYTGSSPVGFGGATATASLEVEIKDSAGQEETTRQLVKITDPNGNTLEMNDKGITLASTTKIVLKGGSTTVTVDNDGAEVT